MAIQTIGISNRQYGNTTVARKMSPAAVTHGFLLGHIMYLQDGGLQGGHIINDGIVSRIYAVETKSQTNHIHLALWEMLDACRVADMAQDMVFRISLLQGFGTFLEQVILMG